MTIDLDVELEAERRRRGLSRRQFARLMAGAGLGAVLASCGEPGSELVTQNTPTVASATAASAGPGNRATASSTARPTQIPSPAPTEALPTGAPTHEASAIEPPTQEASATEPPTPQASPTQAPSPSPAPTNTPPGAAYLAVARGEDPRAITRAALAAIGGMERFVRSGDDVIVKPNICVDYYPYEYAATTNPGVVAALVEMCLAAGARRVRVIDNPFGGGAASAYERSGIGPAVQAAGGSMEVMNSAKYRETDIQDGRDIRSWSVYQEVLSADVLIDVPIAKHHNLARLTLGGKNLLGVVRRPSGLHSNLGQRIADLVSLVRPALTVVDAVRMLMAHGPTGGNLGDVRLANTVIASHDIVAADAYATTLFGLAGADIAYVRAAAEMGLGTMDLDSIRIEQVSV